MKMILKMGAATTTLMNMTPWRQKTQTTMMTMVKITLIYMFRMFKISLTDMIFCVPQIKTMKTLMGETEEMTAETTENPKTDHRKIK